MSDYDTMVSLENELAEHLGDNADVDGHDSGSGETNVFIQTSDLENTLKTAKAVLESSHLLDRVTVAYRRLHDEIYTVDWPDGFEGIFIKKSPQGHSQRTLRNDPHASVTTPIAFTTTPRAISNCSVLVRSLLSISKASAALMSGSAARLVSSSSRRSMFSSTLA